MARLVLPEGATDGTPHVLARVSQVLREHDAHYGEALHRCGGAPDGDPAAYNELLRISYNFAADASELVRLILSISDLKPVVMWGTLGVQHRLARAVEALLPHPGPGKPSIKSYETAIGDARNGAFHHFFPFRKSLDVSLNTGDLREPSLRLFSEFGRRKENQLSYKDKELIDVLTNFTRARERRVPPSFWSRNREVMRATIALFDATGTTLTAIHRAVHRPSRVG